MTVVLTIFVLYVHFFVVPPCERIIAVVSLKTFSRILFEAHART
jgi:hypothetical protein